jgi:hypothetical protein
LKNSTIANFQNSSTKSITEDRAKNRRPTTRIFEQVDD